MPVSGRFGIEAVYPANPVEQSHWRINHRYSSTLDFGEFEAA